MTEKLTIAQFKALKQPKKSKYGSKKTVVDGIVFHSKKEGTRWQQLVLMQKVGAIADLQRQVAYPLVVDGKKICVYKADFVYTRVQGGKIIVEDAKGYRTPAYRLKAKLFEACYGFPITET